MAKRISKFLGGPNPKINVEVFNKDELNKDNFINQLLVITKDDISSSLIMDLFGSFKGDSFIHHYDTFEVPAGAFKFENDKGKIVSNTKRFITTFGIWIFNVFFLRDFNFSKLFGGYVNKNLTKKEFGKIHQTILYGLMEDKIELENYKQFLVNADFVMPWETILSPAQSEGLLSCTKEIDKLKSKLLKENKEAVDNGDADTIGRIEKELIAFAEEYLKDDPAMDSYISGAGGTIPNNFKNMYIMKGAVRNTDPNAEKEFEIATSSFLDGISQKEYSILCKSLSGGPYSRSKKTEIGGYWEKLIEAAMNTVKITVDDCGSKNYLTVTLTPDMFDAYIYSYVVKPNGELEELTSDNKAKYLNKTVKIRSTLFCKEFAKTGCVCNACAGNFFRRRGTDNIGLACAAIPTKLKLTSMKSFHDSTVNLTEIDPMRAFGFK